MAAADDRRVVLLLRGINVGGRHTLPMAVLRTLLAEEFGCTEVRTYVQSGNVVCDAPAAGLDASRVAAALARRFSFPVPVILRDRSQWQALLAANPFVAQQADPAFLHAAFFAEPLSTHTMERLDTLRTGEEQIIASGHDLYLSLPHGVGRSRLALGLTGPGVGGSIRNWRTVLALGRML